MCKIEIILKDGSALALAVLPLLQNSKQKQAATTCDAFAGTVCPTRARWSSTSTALSTAASARQQPPTAFKLYKGLLSVPFNFTRD